MFLWYFKGRPQSKFRMLPLVKILCDSLLSRSTLCRLEQRLPTARTWASWRAIGRASTPPAWRWGAAGTCGPCAATFFHHICQMLHDAGHLVPFVICLIRICYVFSLFLSVLFREHMKYYIKKVAKHFQNKTDLRFNVNGFHSELTGDFSDWTTSNDVLPYDSSGIPPGAVICNLPRYRLEFLRATYWPCRFSYIFINMFGIARCHEKNCLT